ncbi:MAG: DCC1-like thiol-disulfide oxidoreductase family protein [Bacteroidetes bacterium]|nr:DCC1-like thiol-disulfide oxidoreductase family protein [Bacteroidota bacterium]
MNHPVIFFDGVCNLCNGAVRTVIKLDSKRHFRFSSLQSEFAKRTLQPFHINTTNSDSIILLENNHIYQKSEALFRIIKKLKWINFLNVFSRIPFKVSNLIYDFIAKNRYNLFGKKENCPLPDRNLDWLFLG